MTTSVFKFAELENDVGAEAQQAILVHQHQGRDPALGNHFQELFEGFLLIVQAAAKVSQQLGVGVANRQSVLFQSVALAQQIGLLVVL